MATIQIILEPELLEATDRAAKNGKLNRSALIRQALQAHLKKLRIQELEECERRAYEAMPQTPKTPQPVTAKRNIANSFIPLAFQNRLPIPPPRNLPPCGILSLGSPKELTCKGKPGNWVCFGTAI